MNERTCREDTVRNCDRCNRRYTHFISNLRRRRHSIVDCQIPKQIRATFVLTFIEIHFMSVLRTLYELPIYHYEPLSVSYAFCPLFFYTRENLEAYGSINEIGKKRFSSYLWFCHVMFVCPDGGSTAKWTRRSLTKSNRLEAIITISALQTTQKTHVRVCVCVHQWCVRITVAIATVDVDGIHTTNTHIKTHIIIHNNPPKAFIEKEKQKRREWK